MPTLVSPALSVRARAIGIRDDESWPYGPNIDAQSRLECLCWAEAYKLKLSHVTPCLHWLTKGRCGVAVCGQNQAKAGFEWVDHVTGWTRGGKPAVLVAHPYGLFAQDIAALSELTQAHGLWLFINGTGWYGHGTTFVQLWRQPMDSDA